ncbi:MAG: GNAT family N-acetyltransferase [Symbiobacteriia bacterium]
MQLTGDRIVLRRPQAVDVEFRYRWFADPDVTRFLPLAGRGALPREDIASYIARVSESDRPVLDFTIALLNGQPIGSCSLRDFDKANRAELSLLIGDRSVWGQGYGREAMRLLTDHGFRDLGMHALWLVVRADNQRAVKLYHGLGFRLDGTMRAAALADGVYYDKLLMSILATEWDSHLAKVTT